MAATSQQVFEIVPQGDRWALKVDDEILIVVADRDDAAALAEGAARILAASPRRSRFTIAPERRTFAQEDEVPQDEPGS